MQEMIKTWAAKFGMKPEQIEAGVGALLGFIQSKVPAAQFAQLSGLIPQAQQWIGKAAVLPAAAQGAASGLMGQAMGMLGKVSSGAQGGIAQVLAQLQQAGFKPETAMQFVPAVLNQIKSVAGKEKFEQLLSSVPVLKDALAGGVQGLLGKFMNKPPSA